jgi:predicted nucleotidyltransferase
MISGEIIKRIKEVVIGHFNGDVRFFIFGSSVIDEKFNDIDLGIIGKSANKERIEKLKEEFEESSIPYKIDIINFNDVDRKFHDKILREKIIWLT